jgi:type I restriction enzyme R subunit
MSVDWNLKENARARMKVAIKRTLRKHQYPENATENTIKAILKQAEAHK